MTNVLRAMTLATMTAAAVSLGIPGSISGIGVGTIINKTGVGPSKALLAFTLTNNAQVTDTLAKTNGFLDGCAINTYGTHVAFVEDTGGRNMLCVRRTDRNSSVIKTLVATPNFLSSSESGGVIEWPRGDWILYVNNKGQSPTVIYRVNVQTGEQQELLRTTEKLYYASTTWDLGWIYCGQVDAGRAGWYRIPDLSTAQLPLNPQAAFTYTIGGCGHCISPSGLYQSSNVGSGHNYRAVLPMTSPGVPDNAASWGFDCVAWNRWNIDLALDYQSQYAAMMNSVFGTTFPNHVGLGINNVNNRYCRNSDKWVELLMGWTDRFCSGNGNLILVNHVDSHSVNVSRIPLNSNINDWTVSVIAHDFWLSSPITDVVSQLQSDVSARDSYRVAGIDEGASFIVPGVPGSGHRPVSAVARLRAVTRTQAGPGPEYDLRGRSMVTPDHRGGYTGVTILPGASR